jgi:DnaJ-class molecular chaperone
MLPNEKRKNMYKEICKDCKGNGYIRKDKDVIQCTTCKSEGEIKYGQAEVDSFIYDTYFRKRV